MYYLLCINIRLKSLRTLDLSNNKIKFLPGQLSALKNIKTLKLESNKLKKGSLRPVSDLSNLATLTLSNNKLGLETDDEGKQIRAEGLPPLPQSLKQLKLDSNYFQSVPRAIYAANLIKLEKIDLSRNNLAAIPEDFCIHLKSLVEVNLNNNSIVSLPQAVGQLKKLKSLSLENNKITVNTTSKHNKGTRTNFSDQNPQPLPSPLFTETPLIDLNLKGNALTNTQLNEFEGFGVFLERRQTLKSKNIYGGALTDLSVCGLE